jgi:Na+/proline symporter
MEFASRTYGNLIIVLTVVLAVGFGLAAARSPLRRTPEGFFLGNRMMGAMTVGATLFAGTLWNFLPLGVYAGSAVLPVALLLISFAIGLVLLGILSGRRTSDASVFTLPGVLRNRIGENAGFVVSVSYVIVVMFVRIPLSILLGTRILGATAGWEPLSSGLLIVVLPGLLAIAGGFSAVIAAQRVQAIVAIVGISVVAMMQVPLSALIVPFAPAGQVSVWFAFVGTALILGIWYGALDQSVAQRVFSASSARSAMVGAVVAAGLLAVSVLLLLSTGFGGREQADLTNGTFVRGMLSAAILSLTMASLSADFMSVSTIVTMDVFRRFHVSADSAGFVLIGRIAITFVVLVSILATSTLLLAENDVATATVHGTMLLVSPIVAVFVVTLAWSGVRPIAVSISLIVGWAIAIAQMAMTFGSGMDVDSSVMASGALFVFVSLLCIVISLRASRKLLPVREEAPIIQKRIEAR